MKSEWRAVGKSIDQSGVRACVCRASGTLADVRIFGIKSVMMTSSFPTSGSFEKKGNMYSRKIVLCTILRRNYYVVHHGKNVLGKEGLCLDATIIVFL